MSNTKKVAITVNKDPKTVFEILKSVGLTEASLEGNVAKGVVVDSLIGPLKTVDGVVDIRLITDDEPVEQVPPAPILEPVRETSMEETIVERPFFTIKSRRDSI